MLNSEERVAAKSCFLFSKASEEEFSEFLKSGECFTLCFSKGQEVPFEKDGQKLLGILISGKLCALPEGGQGAIKTFLSGELFGAASVFCKTGSEPFSKLKAEHNCKVFFITRKGIENLICSSPERALDYIGFLSDRVAFLNRRISTFTAGEALSRLAKFLLENSGEGKICRDINFSALAKSLDISRASLYRAKSELIRLGAISAEKKEVIILNAATLKNVI